MAKATTTIQQALNYQPEHGAWFATTQALFNRVAAFYFHVIQAHEQCEHLGNLQPAKGKYSHRGNMKRAFWMKGRIFTYVTYKAWNERIITSRVNPKNTSRECARCGAQVVRYAKGQPEEGYTAGAPLVLCPECHMRGHADRNASIIIGQRLLARYHRSAHQQKVSQNAQEKPHAPLPCGERELKDSGVSSSQDAKGRRRPSFKQAGHGAGNAHGTAQDRSAGMAADGLDIPPQLRLFTE